MPSIGKDLAKIRLHLGYTLHDIQQAIKIPVSTIESIEDNSIFSKSDESMTYIRGFVRSYGKELKIDDQTMIKALDQQQSGNYNHLLLQQFPDLSGQKQSPDRSDQNKAKEQPQSTERDFFTEEVSGKVEKSDAEEKKESTSEINDEEPHQTKEKTPEDEPEEEQPPKPAEPEKVAGQDSDSVKKVDWANVGKKFKEEKKPKTGWIFGLILLITVAAAAGYFLYQNGFFDFAAASGDTQTEEPQATQGGISLDFEEPEPEIEEQPPAEPVSELDNVLYITVYAAYDVLDPVRVWSDLKPRMDPYWIEQGIGLNFEFQDTIRIRGQYNNYLLFLNGHLVEDTYDEHYNQDEDFIELTREKFEADPKWGSSISFEIPEGVSPPDSIADRPSF